MIIVCQHCQGSPRDGVELFKVHTQWICREHLRTDLIGIKKHFELERKAKKIKK